ncbi:high-affinity branched-chain amino acid ABC transporter permease LivM [Candidatus Magnetaquicoccus inordinatus]|uniref:high-affinity branched-chain amino acid ABC transporter permease LivM n=1 Tax=Candidatus Magnetaquicoccus inordinatus TaxID=2496818 RepID=UPI00102C5D5F|nr:high-affinity branched-chain amino acid ABC transporter permease LivM [Candidatus Magnetaquicoccus inordinatus]
MSSRVSRALRVAVVALLLFAPITGLVLSGYQLSIHWQRPLWLAAAVLVGYFTLSWLMQHLGWLDRFAASRSAVQPTATIGLSGPRPVWIGAAILFALLLPFVLGKYAVSVAILALIYLLLGLGLNIVVGLAGLLDLGFVAFYAVGAYTYALGYHYFHLSFWLALPLGALLAALFGMILGFPVLRLHGDYLAIVTLGFGEIIRLVLNNWVSVTGGPNGVSVPFPTLLGLEFNRKAKQGGVPIHEFFAVEYSSDHRSLFLYFLLLIVVALLILMVIRLKRMPIGRAWEALRENEVACRSLGIHHVTVKLSAFGLGAMVGGVGGVFFAALQGFVNPTSFTFFESAYILAIVVLGGMGSTTGVIGAALLLTVLPELLRDFSDYRVLSVGIAMVLMMVWRPRGLRQRRRPFFVIPAQDLPKAPVAVSQGVAEQ